MEFLDVMTMDEGGREILVLVLDDCAGYGRRLSNEELLEVVRHSPGGVVVDLGQFDWISGYAIGLLVRAFHAVNDRGGKMAFFHVSEDCTHVFQVTNLTQIWTCYKTYEDAVEAVLSQDDKCNPRIF